MSYRRHDSGLWLPERRTFVHEDAPIRAPRGEVVACLDGVEVWRDHNLYTSLGYQKLAAFLAAGSPAAAPQPPAHLAVGTSATAPAAGDTAMGQEIYRVALSSAVVVSSYTARFAATFSGTVANGAITELGLFDTGGYPTDALGTATSYTTTTLTDSGAAWTTNQHAGSYVYIVSATTGAGQRALISSNTATTLTFPAITLPTGTVGYRIGSGTLYAHAAATITKSSGQVLSVVWSVTFPTS